MPSTPAIARGKIRLKDFAPDDAAGRDKRQTKKRTRKLARRIGELQKLLYANGTHALLLVFQGMDASGKDGAIKRLLRDVAPTGVEVTNFRRPSAEENAHDFLWRVHRAVPRYGYIGVFNRSHYEAVLVERVELGVPSKTCAERYAQIVAFERMLAQNRVVVLKFFLHLSRGEQAERLKARQTDPHKRWKFRREDLITRLNWEAYQAAYEETLNATSHARVRWHIIPADRKWYRDYAIAQAVVRALTGLRLKWPQRGT
jgi:PPK2 family polyphosphate:nucleotide phosphotransferase